MIFILLIDKFPELPKSDINSGNTPFLGLKLVGFLRNIFLLSNKMRTGNTFYIYCSNQFENKNGGLIIKIKGKELRFISPDERTTLLVFDKINLIISNKTNKQKIYQEKIEIFNKNLWAQSTPGIDIKRGNFSEIITELIQNNKLIFINETEQLAQGYSLKEIINQMDQNSVILFNCQTAIDILRLNELHSLNPTILKMKDDDVFNSLFDWQVITIIQTLYENQIQGGSS